MGLELDDLRERAPLWRANEELQARVYERQQLRDILLRNAGQLKAGLVHKLIEADTVHWGEETRDNGFVTNFKAGKRNAVMPELQAWICKLWSASIDNVPQILEQFWDGGISGGGHSLPTMIVHLHYPEHFAPWYSAAHKGIRKHKTQLFKFGHQQTWSLYSRYNYALQSTRDLSVHEKIGSHEGSWLPILLL